jgi:hypothetical protein
MFSLLLQQFNETYNRGTVQYMLLYLLAIEILLRWRRDQAFKSRHADVFNLHYFQVNPRTSQYSQTSIHSIHFKMGVVTFFKFRRYLLFAIINIVLLVLTTISMVALVAASVTNFNRYNDLGCVLEFPSDPTTFDDDNPMLCVGFGSDRENSSTRVMQFISAAVTLFVMVISSVVMYRSLRNGPLKVNNSRSCLDQI